MGLLFKARSQDIQGMPRVYFSAEATDYSRYMEPICEEILKYQNCCIWYPEPETDRSAEDFLDDLSDMQLFVIPVTSNLIFHSSGNVKREFDLATARHIPVLPIMVEDDLSEPFNRIFGELQYLDRYKVDETAIRYEEKLEKFLSSVLVGDELAAKVRAAFDAYVFLSYRKKDRKYAQELMRLIHKNEFCRDIAIWYDEFLTPGENFNDAIRDALRKSELFVLTVTPNLVNELNYIVTTEYPLAKSENKTIVPAELVATDRAQLAEFFADFPDCTDAHDDAQLSKTLLSALAGVAVRENDGDDEHNFFIGLAYLSGIDVEIDHARALRLITESAEAGLLEAMDQLMRMYRSGTGVPRDMEKVLYWQERKITTLRSCYDSVPTKESFEALVGELLNCGDNYTETNQPSRCMALYEEALILSRKADYPAVGFREAAALRSMGSYVLAFEQDGPRARVLVEESVTASRKLHEEQNCERSKRSLATGLIILGNLCRQTNDMVAARNYTEESERLFAELYKEYASEEDRESLMYARDVLCLLYYKRQDLWDKALEYAKESLAYGENEAAEKKTARAKYNLSAAYSRLDDVYGRAPRSIEGHSYYTERKEACQRSYDIAKELCEEDPSPSNKRALSICCQKLAKLTETFDGYDQALSQEAVRLLREVFEASPTARAKEDFAYVLMWSCSGKGDHLPNYLRATELREELVRELGTEESKRTLSQTYQKLAKEYQYQAYDPQDPWHYVPYDQAPAAYDKVEEYYQKSIRILEELSSRSSEGKYLDDLAYTYKKLGDVYSSAGRKQDAQAAMRTSISVYEKQYRIKESAFACQSLLSQCSHEMGLYGCLSSTSEERLAYLQLCHNAANEYKYLNTKWKPGGVSFDLIAEAVQTDLAEKLTRAENSAEQARLHMSLAQLNFYWERYEKAEQECMCAQELVKGSPGDAMLRIAIQALELRGDMYLACNRVQSPRDCYTEALRLAQDRSAEEASDDVIRLLKKSGDAFFAYLDVKLDLGEFDAPGSEQVHVLEQKNKKFTHFKYDPHGEITSMDDKAHECYKSALSLLVGQKDIASLRRMGEIHSTLVGLAPSAGLRQYHRQETVEIFQQIHDRMPMSVKAKTDLIEALLAAGRYDASIPGAIRAPKEYLDHALYLADELDKLEYSPDIKNALGDIYFVIGDTYRMEFRDDAIAKSAYHRGISTYATVHEDYKRISTGNQLADAYFHYVYAYPKDAGGYSDEAIRVLRDLHENNLDDLSCAEKYFRACFERNCLSQEMNYLIEKAHKARTIESYITLARQCRAVAQFASTYQRKAEFFRHAYEIMTWLPKERLGEEGLRELEDATHNARAFREFHPHLFKEEDPDA